MTHSRTLKLMTALLVWGVHAQAETQTCVGADCTSLNNVVEFEGVPWSIMVREANDFFGTQVRVFLTDDTYTRNGEENRIDLPSFIPSQIGVAEDQVHIPYIYFASVSNVKAENRNSIWYFIIGHEFAHAYQSRTRLLSNLAGPFSSVVAVELHADYLAGFYIGRTKGLSDGSVEQIFATLRSLPSGERDLPDFHGTYAQRMFVTSQGALFAYFNPSASLTDAASCGIETVLEVLTGTKGIC